MRNSNPFGEFIENELNLDARAEHAVERLRRRSEAIVALLLCLEKLRRLRCACAPYDRIPRTNGRG